MLDYILEVNRNGRTFAEAYTSLVLTKIQTPWPVGFVDLQSPAGAGLSVVVYNYDGDVYASDESRMLAEMGDTSFDLAMLKKQLQKYFLQRNHAKYSHGKLQQKAIAGCSDCAYHIYCGADPVRSTSRSEILRTQANERLLQEKHVHN